MKLKLDIKTMVFLFISGIILFVGFVYMLYFDKDFISEKFPYKYHYIAEQETKAMQLHQKNTQLIEELNQLKGEIKNLSDNNILQGLQSDLDSITIQENDVLNNYPIDIDEASLLLYIDEQALLNDIIITNLDVKGQNNNDFFNSMDLGIDLNNITSRYGISGRAIYLTVLGDYENIEFFISNLNNDFGAFNKISRSSLKRSNSKVLNWVDIEVKDDRELNNEDMIEYGSNTLENSETLEDRDIPPAIDINKNITVDLEIQLIYRQ